ncbi:MULTISPECIES: hypothetical protein [unclassified Bosea (in: a-proteobacteria)]|uniref:hypothetical protein n=1 Tax=unclassified Bosea (in: a-proteobacteria) TaxID=2653178 RepID=UPI000F764D27|nr:MULTISPECIES: hypothetical protein [unclassified Bosea (in: a-proteobacteria)]AZO76208.1 hypothetical protein BLM15_00290 [Bosea sp. Tri-49]RXT26133.1 hypothetical protein B5U98_06200 [Bosea sp. Tri-39]RXT31375.1 hypothetical protein B5U99_21745 [Bosea sp. Tri-54]
MWSLTFAPLVPLPLLIGLAVLAAAAAGMALVLAGRSAILRALALTVLAVALADPSLVFEDREPVKDVVAVVVDKSASNRLADRTQQTQAAQAEVERQLRGISGVETRTIEVTDQQGAGDGTRLFEALASGLADVPSERVAGAIVLSDGLAHDAPATAEALGLRAPLHVLTTGREREIDRRIVLVDSPRFGIVGKEQNVRLRVVDKGGPGRAAITVRRDGEIIARREAITGETIQVPVRIDRGGPNVIEIEAAPLADELTLANNRAVITIEGVRDKLRVLLVSGEPHPGERTWRNLLKADANVDLVHFTILRPPEKQDGTPINELSLIAFPTRELFQVKIKDFDLIIFDRYANQSILPLVYFDNIVRYVRDGGALLIAAGPEYSGAQSLARTPLGQILPAQPDGSVIDEAYRARVSEPGKRHPVTRDLPGSETEPPRWGEWLRMIGARTRSGSAVMTGPGERPLLLLAREQKGRVALFLSDHAWLWARGFRDGGPHLDLLRRLGHWLMKEPDLEEEALRASARGRNIEIERQTLGDNPAPAVITAPDGSVRTVPFEAGRPGLFVARTAASEFGLHKITTENLTAFASIGPENPRELMEVVSDPSKLQALAEATGGSSRRIGQENGSGVTIPRIVPVRSGRQFAGADWIGLRISDSGIVRGVSISPLFVGLIGLAILFGALVAGWIGESGRRFKREV